MSYHHTIEPNEPGRTIALDDLRAAQGQFRLDHQGGNVVITGDDVSFSLFHTDGQWWAERLSEAQIFKAALLAERLDATLVGDEGERYRVVDGVLIETPAARFPPPSPTRRVLQSTHPMTLALWAGGALLILLLIAMRLLA